MTYQETADQIIKDSIKSAIFIDENALSFYSHIPDNWSIEEKLSQDLYLNFKDKGISLAIHKYAIGDEIKEELSKYLYEDRDLVLLDWNLTGESGEEFSLKMLSDIVKRGHIHFCVIYTKESNDGLDRVFNNILSYFSCKDVKYYLELKEQLELEEGIESIIGDLNFINLYRDNIESGKRIGLLSKNHPELIRRIIELTDEPIKKCALIKASIAFSDTRKSENENPCPTIVSPATKMIVIDNTIITLLNKSDNKPDTLLAKLSLQVTSNESSFTQLLGLEMKNILDKNSSFIDSNLLKISKDAFVHHWNHYKKEKQESLFSEFVKDVLMENVGLQLRDKQLSLLNNNLLNSFDEVKNVKDEELISMNVFYNAHQLNIPKKLNFGDVFISSEGNEYYICITALCDCLRSEEKIDNNFFFAIGTNISKAVALKLGDTAFISYLNSSKIVKWTDVNNMIGDDEHKYSPIYIKPVQYKVLKPEFNEFGEIELGSISADGLTVFRKVKYATTIKSSYAQRIANHAFSHPLRVGIDFAKNSNS
jgi:hypothetical protein